MKITKSGQSMKKRFLFCMIFVLFICTIFGCKGKSREPVYQTKYLGLDGDYRYINAIDTIGDDIFVLGTNMGAADKLVSNIVKLDSNGNKKDSIIYTSEQFEPIAEGWVGDNTLIDICVENKDGIWLLEQHYSFEMLSDSKQMESGTRLEYALTKIDFSGNVLLSFNISDQFEGAVIPLMQGTIACDGMGNIHLLSFSGEERKLTVFSPKGEVIFQPEAETTSMAASENGKISVITSFARRELWSIIKGLKGKITIILTTHYLEEAEALADRIGIMARGRLRAVGTAAQLKEKAGCENFEDAFITLAGEGETK